MTKEKKKEREKTGWLVSHMTKCGEFNWFGNVAFFFRLLIEVQVLVGNLIKISVQPAITI